MVDVGGKPLTARRAVAAARVLMSPATRALALSGGGPKGAVLETAAWPASRPPSAPPS